MEDESKFLNSIKGIGIAIGFFVGISLFFISAIKINTNENYRFWAITLAIIGVVVILICRFLKQKINESKKALNLILDIISLISFVMIIPLLLWLVFLLLINDENPYYL